MIKNKKTFIIKIITLIVATSLLFLHYRIIKPWMLDDAFISFRYAENFANGDGLVFNPGGEHTEGYTNFLWVMILAFGKTIGFNIVALSKMLGFLFSIGTLSLILFYPRKDSLKTKLTTTILLATTGAFTVWASSGMETSLFTFILTLLALSLQKVLENQNKKKLIALGIINSLLGLTRPEGYIVFFIVLTNIAVKSFLTNRKNTVRAITLFATPFLLTAILHLVFRLIYYDDFLPNTFYNKVSSTLEQLLRGIRYARQFIGASSLLLLPIIIWGVVRIRKIKTSDIKKMKFRTSNLAFVFLCLIYTAYIIFVGGDVMPGYRFFAPIVPIFTLLSARGLNNLANFYFNRKTRPITLSLTALAICMFNVAQWKLNIKYNKHLIGDKVAENGREAGLWLKENFPRDTIIATNTGGTIPYYSKFKTVDMLGLNNKHIAKRQMPDMGKGYPGHEKTDAKYILNQNPDIIQIGSSLGSAEPILVSGQELFETDEFKEKYKLESFELPSGKYLQIYIRDD